MYYGYITSLSISVYKLAATTVRNYALSGGRHTGSTYSAVIDAYKII